MTSVPDPAALQAHVVDASGTRFEAGVALWTAGLGRLRDVVRQRLVAEQLQEVLAEIGPSTVLDVGCGQGTQALALARTGLLVTGLDSSDTLLAKFAHDVSQESAAVHARVTLVRGPGEQAPSLTPGPFDVVLCHGVLMYLDDPAVLLQSLTQVTATGSLLSVLVRNGMAPAMRDGLRGHFSEALPAFDSLAYVNRLGLAARAHTIDELDALLIPLGWQRTAWFGVRVFTDHLDEPAPDPATLGPLVAAELEAGRRDPYRSVAALLHACYIRV